MTRPEPVEYRVVLDVQTALRQITQTGGYFHDLAGLAVKLDPNQGVEELASPDGARPFVVLEVKPDTWTYSDAQDRTDDVLRDQAIVTVPITVHWINSSDPTVDEGWMQEFFRGCADIEQALGLDRTRGGMALQTRLTQRRYDEAFSSAQVWAMVDYEILIYRTLGLPNSAPVQ